MDKKITHLLGILLFSCALLATGTIVGAEVLETGEAIEGEVVITDIEVVEDDAMEVDEDAEVVDEDTEEGTEEPVDVEDDFIDFEDFEDDFDDTTTEEGDMTMVIVVLAVVALGLVVFLVTRKR